MKDKFDKFLEELVKKHESKIKEIEEQTIKKFAQKKLFEKVEDYLWDKYRIKGYIELEPFKFVSDKPIIVEGTLETEFGSSPLRVLVTFDKEGRIENFSLKNEEEIRKNLEVKAYAVKVPSVGIYKVESVSAELAVEKVLDEVFEEIDRIDFYNRRFGRRNKVELKDLILREGYVKDWEDYAKKEDFKKEEEIVPDTVVELERRASVYIPSDDWLESHPLENVFSDEEKDIYSYIKEELELKKQIASAIENHLKEFGIDAEVTIEKMEKQGKVVKGSFELTSSYVSGNFPFVAEVENGFLSSVSFRDYEIKKMAGLKVYKVTVPQYGEVLVSGVDAIVAKEAVERLVGKKLDFADLVEKYGFKEVGMWEAFNDAKKVNPWVKLNVGGEDYLIRLK